jgi:hypothetical protein
MNDNIGVRSISGNSQLYGTLLLSSSSYPDLLATAGGNILTDICIAGIGAVMCCCMYKRESVPHPQVHCSSAPTSFEQTDRKTQMKQWRPREILMPGLSSEQSTLLPINLTSSKSLKNINPLLLCVQVYLTTLRK